MTVSRVDVLLTLKSIFVIEIDDTNKNYPSGKGHTPSIILFRTESVASNDNVSIYIRNMVGSNLGRNTNYPEFPQLPRRNFGKIFQVMLRFLPSTSYLIHDSLNHPALPILCLW